VKKNDGKAYRQTSANLGPKTGNEKGPPKVRYWAVCSRYRNILWDRYGASTALKAAVSAALLLFRFPSPRPVQHPPLHSFSRLKGAEGEALILPSSQACPP